MPDCSDYDYEDEHEHRFAEHEHEIRRATQRIPELVNQCLCVSVVIS